jgi:hypothetical protein
MCDLTNFTYSYDNIIVHHEIIIIISNFSKIIFFEKTLFTFVNVEANPRV